MGNRARGLQTEPTRVEKPLAHKSSTPTSAREELGLINRFQVQGSIFFFCFFFFPNSYWLADSRDCCAPRGYCRALGGRGVRQGWLPSFGKPPPRQGFQLPGELWGSLPAALSDGLQEAFSSFAPGVLPLLASRRLGEDLTPTKCIVHSLSLFGARPASATEGLE